MAWIFLTLCATILQTFRNIEQKKLGQKLDLLSASWSRFILPFPIAILTVILTIKNIDHNFFYYCAICAIFQIFGNSLMVKTLQSKNFSVGIAFYKTEALQVAIVGVIIFNQHVSLVTILAIIIATIGIIMISNLKFKHGKKEFFKSLKSPSTGFGLLSGFCFSITGYNLKFATANLVNQGLSQINSGLLTLMWVIFLQNLFYILIKSLQKRFKNDLKNIFNAENKSTFFKAGFFSFCGSVCWFCAYSFGDVILIKTLGQIEIIFALLVSHFMMKEKNNLTQIIGIFLVLIGIIVTITSNS
jgi:drug/metabolite transporter (DMT)-like permease